MDGVASGLDQHRVIAANLDSVCNGAVRYAPSKSLWFFGMLAGGLVGGVTMGECWHNNHHAFPGSARLALAPGEWDPGWWVLLGLRRLGLVWAIRLPADLPNRPELVTISPSAPGKPFLNTKILTRTGIDGHGLVT